MTALETETWVQGNQRRLAAELDRLHAHLSGGDAGDPGEGGRLHELQAAFGLSAFERDILLWCAGAELDGRFTHPTFDGALSALDDPHWDALSPDGPLRRWRMIHLTGTGGLVQKPLHLDERILHHLIGVTCVDPQLGGTVRAVAHSGLLTPAQQAVAAAVASDVAGGDQVPAVRVLVDGSDEATRERIGAFAAGELGRVLLVVHADRLPPPGPDSAILARLVEREAVLLSALPMLAVTEADRRVPAWLEEVRCSVVIGAPAAAGGVPHDVRRNVPSPMPDEQAELWRQLLGADSGGAEAAAAFRFEVPEIETVARSLGDQSLHYACRLRARVGLDDLADRIEPIAGWSDLIVPDAAMSALHDIESQVRHRARVYGEWAMAGSSARGLGVTALFAGESGTGKTLAAEVLAAALDLDLYRIDLAAVVSKYIGETEKNLKRVFDAADASGAVLLFDEADALFGKRSEVRDSHDRYANLEISYLLQRMETYRGLAVLTSNLKSALDRSFLRRLRFVVSFPFPDAAARARIWRLMFPPRVPLAPGLDFQRLAQLQLPGGHIRTVAMGAAFLAAAANDAVSMDHVLAAARREYAKLEKPLTDAEIGGWR